MYTTLLFSAPCSRLDEFPTNPSLSSWGVRAVQATGSVNAFSRRPFCYRGIQTGARRDKRSLGNACFLCLFVEPARLSST